MVCATFPEVSKASDNVWHVGWIFKLRQFGITCTLISLLKNDLTDRSHRVVLNGKTSPSQSISSGGSSGFHSWSLAILIDVNDVIYNNLIGIKLFADDIALIKEIDNSVYDFCELNNDLKTLSVLSKQLLITCNA